MKINLTEKQVVLLGWDEPSCEVRPIQVKRGQWSYDLEPGDVEELRLVAETSSFGCDPSDVTSAKALLRKLDKKEETK